MRLSAVLLVLAFVFPASGIAQPQSSSRSSAAAKEKHEMLTAQELKEARLYTTLEEAMVHPEKVYKLYLTDKEFESFPMEVLMFKHLQVLNLSDNKIDSLPPEVASLTYLEELNLRSNRIEALPRTIADLQNLNKLYLARNRLTRFPYTMTGMPRLKYLDVSLNDILLPEIKWIQEALPKTTIRY
jgi:Leucine-rich repeat (LRR) protein